MAGTAPILETRSRLAENIVHFVRALRKAGVRVGPAQTEGAVRAVEVAGFTRKDDFYHILRATLINRPEHLEVFDQVFALFWRDPEYLEKLINLMSTTIRRDEAEAKKKHGERRAAEALTDEPEAPRSPQVREELQVEAKLSWSAEERLRSMDFEQMSVVEIAEAKRAIAGLRLAVKPILARRARLAARGRQPALHATLRRAMRRGGEVDRIAMRAPRVRPPDLVALCDISGSMSVYSRMILHFLHALAWSPERNWGRVSAFTFGTRLTNITRALGRKDIDEALDAISREAPDWQGGTRIGAALERFNKDWSRRVLSRGAVVLLITDGLERQDAELLAHEAERLHKSCRRLIWLNPLLRWSEFQPKAAGIRALLPHVDAFRTCHSVDGLADLAGALGGASGARTPGVASRDGLYDF